MKGDEAFYYLHREGELIGTVITHVDDFTFEAQRLSSRKFWRQHQGSSQSQK